MSRVPMGSQAGDAWPYGEGVRQRYGADAPNQGIGAEMIAERWGLSRTQLDEFSLASHAKAAAAQDDGRFADEIVAVINHSCNTVDTDEGVRRDGTVDKLATLAPAFHPDGVVTAGNASRVSDGSSAVLITSNERASGLGLRLIARVHTAVVPGSDPIIMLTGPIPATCKALAKSGLSLDDTVVFEVNEAFVSVPLAWLAETDVEPGRLKSERGSHRSRSPARRLGHA